MRLITDNDRIVAEATDDYQGSMAWIDAPPGYVPGSYEMQFKEETQFDLDQARYQKRAAVRDQLTAYMAADNMSRVRAEVWTVADLTGLLSDPAVAAANALMGTLSFELAAAQINAATTPLLTPDIKADWTARLAAHYYLEG